MIKLIIFDWGDTLMRDFPESKGPMAYWSKVELIDGVYDILRELHKKYRVVVASNASDSDIHLIKKAFERVGVEKYIDNYYSAKEIGAKKPDINFFKEILKKENINPNEAISVGNTYEMDIVPAITLGIKSILYDEERRYINVENRIEKIEELWKKLQEK